MMSEIETVPSRADIPVLALGLYEALMDGQGLVSALKGVAQAVGASSHAMHLVRYRGGKPVESVSAGHGGAAGAPMDDYARYWVRHDPWVGAAALQPPGVHDMARLVPPEVLRRSRIWNEWGRPNEAAFYAVGATLMRDPGHWGGVAFHRRETEPPFSDAETGLLRTLFPHLRRAFAAEAQLGPARTASGAMLRAGLDALPDGVALLDAEGRLVFANAALRDMTAQQDGLTLGPEGLAAPDPPTRLALRRAVTAALAAAQGRVGLLPSAGSLALPRASGGAPWMVRALPVLPRAEANLLDGCRGAMLLIADGEKRGRPMPALLSRLFGLTPAEASLAAALAAGRSLDEHAQRRGVSRETVRSQLAAVRRKTGCRRQTDLVALFARLPG
jgi:DNA-binding CsgD family transcriptional regulator/PAS domain-containing protein